MNSSPPKMTWTWSSLYSIIASRVLLNIKMTLMKTDDLTTLTLQNGEMELQFMGTADTDMTGPGNLWELNK